MWHRDQYQPINCDLYDYLEMWSVKKTNVNVKYADLKGEAIYHNVQILDLKTRNKEEFISFSNGKTLRLDQLIRINQIDFRLKSC